MVTFYLSCAPQISNSHWNRGNMPRKKPLLLFLLVTTTWLEVLLQRQLAAETTSSSDTEQSCFQPIISFCYWCKYVFHINEFWSLKITGDRKRASHLLDNILSLCISSYFSLCNQKRPDNRIRDTCKVKHTCFCRTRGKMWSYKNS